MIGQIIDTEISGIPCQVKITLFSYSKEPHGIYVDFDFDVLDRNGKRAKWLDKKLTEADFERINQDIMNAYRRIHE